MSGVAGADRVKSRADYARFLKDYEQVISKFPGYQGMTPSGSYNSNLAKQDFGDIDLIVHIASDKDKATVKKELQAFFNKMPETVIVPFTSPKHIGKRTYNAGELVTVRYHNEELGYSAQIDNIVALDQSEADFKQQFLDMPAEKQGLILGLVKIAAIETDPQVLFKSLGINAPPLTEPDQEYEFNLSSVELQLRRVTYKPGTYEQISREVVWTSRNFDDLQKLLYQYDLSKDFDYLLSQSKLTIKNPRSNNRMQGVFGSMITVKSGEVGTTKGQGKIDALNKIQQTFKEHRSMFRNLIESNSKKVIFAFGRFQPPTIGHELLVNKVKQIAEQTGSDYVIYVSKTEDKKTNPLSINEKMAFLAKAFPGTNFVAADTNTATPILAIKHLNQQYNEIIWVAGSDRVPVFDKLLKDYNGIEYQYTSANVISSGIRDPDSEDASGMSGTKMRGAASAGNFDEFRQGLPRHISEKDAIDLMNKIQQKLQPVPKQKKPAREDLSYRELNQVEQVADALWNQLGVDVEFTQHFLDRVNDERNGRPITQDELIRLFQKEFERYGKTISGLKNIEAVMKDTLTKINLPFVVKDRGKSKELVAKTVMRKPNFQTPNKIYAVAEEYENIKYKLIESIIKNDLR